MFILKILALVLTAIVLVPSAAHFFELPGKIELQRDAYFTVQAIYAGWALFAVPILAAVVANASLAYFHWRQNNGQAVWAGLAAGLIIASLVVFFIWVFPGNQQTLNWTTQPDNWDALRRNWEYGHATNAVIILLAFIFTCMASVTRS
jgi:hypothetical protein